MQKQRKQNEFKIQCVYLIIYRRATPAIYGMLSRMKSLQKLYTQMRVNFLYYKQYEQK